jgi:hypothetical protein
MPDENAEDLFAVNSRAKDVTAVGGKNSLPRLEPRSRPVDSIHSGKILAEILVVIVQAFQETLEIIQRVRKAVQLIIGG